MKFTTATLRSCLAISCLTALVSISAQKPHVAQPSSANTLSPQADSASEFHSESYSLKPTQLIVGHSAYVNTVHRLSRVYVTNPNVLNAFIATPNQVLVTAKDPGISSLMVWDENGYTQTYLFTSNLDIEGLRTTLQTALPHEDMHVDADQGHILLSGTISDKDKYQLAERLAAQYSKDLSNALIVSSSGVKQVRLKVRIIEVDRTKLEQLGFNLFSAGSNTLGQSTTSQFPSSLTTSTSGSAGTNTGTSATVGSKTVTFSNPLNFLLYNADINVGAMVQDLESKQVLQILAEPNITTISGEKANFLAGGEFPFPVVQGAVSGLTSITVQFRPYGVKLEFTPTVNSDGTIQLKVAPEVSALDYTNAVQISGYTIPALSSRRAETQVVLRDGQSFAISGLLDQRTTDQLSRTPGIASIPILGNLFKSKSINHSKTELMVLVTPETIDPVKSTTPEQPHLPVPLLDGSGFDSKLPHAKDAK